MSSGEEQAKVAGDVLREYGFTRFSQVLVSPLIRARETCALAGFAGEAEPDADLSEWDYGDYEGLTSLEIREQHPGWTLWDDGVPGGERAADVGRRADRIVERVRSRDGDTLCVAHGHLLRVLAARWLGLPPVAGRLFLLGPGGIGVLGWERAFPALEAWNLGAAATRAALVEE